MREWLTRIRDWLRREKLDAELQEELRFHRGRLERDAGAAEAPKRLGNVTRIREQAREIWSIPWLDQLQQDVRYALRGLRRSPGFAATVILTLGLGIGANVAMFGVVDRLMFRPYPYLRDPGTVHRVLLRRYDRGNLRTEFATEYTRYLDLQRWTTSFAQSSGFTDRSMAVGLGEASRERRVALVNATFFDFFDAPPALGRYFLPSEDTVPRGSDVAVLGFGFWQSEFGGREVLGRVIHVGNMALTIVGVAPRGFAGVNDNDPAEVYLPITTYAGSVSNPRDREEYYRRYNWGWMGMMVRRKPDVSVDQASSDLTNAYIRSWDHEATLGEGLTPSSIARPSALAMPMKAAVGDQGMVARTALWVTGVAAIVLLIACANVANLFLARALRRRRETAVRLALGVSRARLVTQSLTESLVLALIGAATGLLVAQWGGAGIRRLLTDNGASIDVFTDWRTLIAAISVALLSALITGVAPAFLASRGDLAASLKAGAREGGYQRSRTRVTLLIAQGTLCVVLLVGAGLFMKSLNNVRTMRLGYDAEPMLLASTNMRGMQVNDSAQFRLGRALLATAQSLPGVEHASWVSSVPFWSTSSTSLYVAGIDTVRRLGRFTYQTATTDYFRSMGTRILRGRGFLPEDRAGAPRIAIVSEGMANVLWPGRDAIGQCMRVGADTMPCTTVVGIAEDMVQRDFSASQRYHYYLPIEQFASNRGFALLLRMRGDPAAQMESVRLALQREMPGTSYITMREFGDMVDAQRRSWRLGATMFMAFGILALAVASVGLYGVIAYNVAQRMHELGVRIALGAQRGDLVLLVAGQGVRFALAGVVAGSAAAFALGTFVQPLLFRQSARDPVIFAVVAVTLLLVGLAASALPAFRATRADPNSALRAE